MAELLTDQQRRELFPVTAEWAYLNNAFRGPVSTPAAQAARGYIDGLSSRGVTAWADWQRTWDDTHAGYAAFINAQPDEVQLLPNATEALTRVTLGIDWRAGDEAVVFERDYPGVVRPLLALRRFGVTVKLLPEAPDGMRRPADLLAAITHRTRLVCASWVDYRTGIKLDVAELAAGCRGRGVLCAIDAVQAIGALAVDVKAVGADAMTFASRKYLNGLDALGALYVRKDVAEALTPYSLGTYSVEKPFDFDRVEQPLAPGARRFMLGAPAMPQVYALQAALRLQREIGAATIHEQTASLAAEVRRRAKHEGFAAFADNWPAECQSHIVSLRTGIKLAVAGLAERLESAKAAASVRQGILRVSPHWYNTQADIDRLIHVLGEG